MDEPDSPGREHIGGSVAASVNQSNQLSTVWHASFDDTSIGLSFNFLAE